MAIMFVLIVCEILDGKEYCFWFCAHTIIYRWWNDDLWKTNFVCLFLSAKRLRKKKIIEIIIDLRGMSDVTKDKHNSDRCFGVRADDTSYISHKANVFVFWSFVISSQMTLGRDSLHHDAPVFTESIFSNTQLTGRRMAVNKELLQI